MQFIFGKTNLKCPQFSRELEEETYAIFSKKKARSSGYYPTKFPEYEDIRKDRIKSGDVFTIRAFFVIGKDKNSRVDSGLLDVEIEVVDGDEIWGNILTELPPSFPLQKNTSIVLFVDELLYFAHGY